MPARLVRAAKTSRSPYVCPFCRQPGFPIIRGQTRYQHTGPPAKVGGDTNQETVSKDHNDSNSPSSIAGFIQSFMFKLDKKAKDSKGESSNQFQEQSPLAPRDIKSIVPQPKDSADVVQRKLQQKFAAQRHKEMLAMQTAQYRKTAYETKDVSKAPLIRESTGPSPKKLSSRRERLWRFNPSKQRQAELMDSTLNTVARIDTFTGFQETSGKGDEKAKMNDDGGNVPGKQGAIAQKLGDIMDVLETSRDPKESENSVEPGKRAGGMGSKSTDVELKRVVREMLDELQAKRESLDKPPNNATAAISRSRGERSASLKPTFEETSPSSKILNESALGEDHLRRPLRKCRSRSRLHSQRSSLQAQSSRVRSTRRSGKSESNETRYPKVMSLRAALTKQSIDEAEARVGPSSEKAQEASAPPTQPLRKTRKSSLSPKSPIELITASDLELKPIMVDQPPVPRLAYGLERVLFNPGVYQLQDPRSRVYNFDPYLQKIMPVAEFDFNALKEYITSSRDHSLNKLAKKHGKRYMGSTSSMTAVLAHFHFLLSQWRPINPSMLSKSFPSDLVSFTEFQRSPSAIFLRWKNGSYAIDADKQFAKSNILSMLGKSMEKFLTLSTDDFERYRKSNPGQVTEDERFAPESYYYSTLGDFLMRSQLDAYDPRLPGTGTFDLKTRSVVSIRMDVDHYQHGVGYEIMNRQGEWESYEREYFDMIRAAFLRYSLQVRMGNMDGIFVAFHNIERIFGFQYISLSEMDTTIHGQPDTSLGDQEFRMSLDLLNKILDRATEKYPETSLRIFFEAREASTNFMYVFAEPVTEEQVAEIQSQNDAKIQEFERNILGLTRGIGSETDNAPEVDPKWEKIQADVQKAMEADELSGDGSGQYPEAIHADAEGTEQKLHRPEVFEHGPLYASKSRSGADDGDDNGHWEIMESKGQKGSGDFLEGDADIKAIDAVEAKRNVDEEGINENSVALSENPSVKVPSTTNTSREELNENGRPSFTSRQHSTHDGKEPRDDEQSIRKPPGVEPNIITEGKGQQGHQIHTDQSFPDSVNEGVVQTDTSATSSDAKDILAMTLTLRNNVNGAYVLRPEQMTGTDEWIIEYSLTEVSDQTRARALYNACQLRRKKKMDVPLVPESEQVVNGYVQKLRKLSEKGRRWRKGQDKIDKELPVQMLSE